MEKIKPKVAYHECPNTPWVNWLIGSCAAIVIVIIIITAIFAYLFLSYFFGIGNNKFNLIENFEVKVEEKVTENIQNKLDEEINKIEDNLYNQWDNVTTNLNPFTSEKNSTSTDIDSPNLETDLTTTNQ